MVLLDLMPLETLNDLVTPGWVPLALVVVLGLVIVGLFFSMRKQLGRINVPVDEQLPVSSRFAGSDDDRAGVTEFIADPDADRRSR